METLQIILQVVIALGIFNVWFLRFNQKSAWRGGDATTMKEEFAAYGLPKEFMYLIGFLKVTFAILLLVGIAVPSLVAPAAIGIAILMSGAVAMHLKIGDPPKRSVPSALMLLMCLVVATI